MTDPAFVLLLKVIGAAAGAVLALVFVPPRTLQGFFRRGAAALISGPIFAPFVQAWAGFSNDADGLISAACLTAFGSWWLMGTAVRIIRGWQSKELSED